MVHHPSSLLCMKQTLIGRKAVEMIARDDDDDKDTPLVRTNSVTHLTRHSCTEECHEYSNVSKDYLLIQLLSVDMCRFALFPCLVSPFPERFPWVRRRPAALQLTETAACLSHNLGPLNLAMLSAVQATCSHYH